LEELGDLFSEQLDFDHAAVAYEHVNRKEPKNGEIIEKIGHIFTHEKNVKANADKAFLFYKKAIKLLKSEVGKQNLASKMYDMCKSNDKEEQMKKYR